MANYLRNYFVSSLMNTITSYPYPGSSCKGTFNSMGTEQVVISEKDGRLFVGIGDNNIAAVSMKYNCLPFAFADGCMQFIDSLPQPIDGTLY